MVPTKVFGYSSWLQRSMLFNVDFLCQYIKMNQNIKPRKFVIVSVTKLFRCYALEAILIHLEHLFYIMKSLNVECLFTVL